MNLVDDQTRMQGWVFRMRYYCELSSHLQSYLWSCILLFPDTVTLKLLVAPTSMVRQDLISSAPTVKTSSAQEVVCT